MTPEALQILFEGPLTLTTTKLYTLFEGPLTLTTTKIYTLPLYSSVSHALLDVII